MAFPTNAFLRDKVPMTKEEVREVSFSKLRLEKDSVIYDVEQAAARYPWKWLSRLWRERFMRWKKIRRR